MGLTVSRSAEGIRSELEFSGAPPATVRTAVEFDYSALTETDELKVRKRVQAIRRRVDRRSLVSSARNVVKVGLWLHTVRRCLGCHRFKRWYEAVFKWKQPRVSKFMRSARVFRRLDCLDNFDPTALYLLSTKYVVRSARREAIRRARAGEQISKAIAESIIDRHRGLPQTIRDLRRACRALRRVTARLIALGPDESPLLARHVSLLQKDWKKLNRILSAGEQPIKTTPDPDRLELTPKATS